MFYSVELPYVCVCAFLGAFIYSRGAFSSLCGMMSVPNLKTQILFVIQRCIARARASGVKVIT